jgi:hypothetical protein
MSDHREVEGDDSDGSYAVVPICVKCGTPWPCETERLRAALVEVLDYAGQLELVAYEQSREYAEHPIMARARAALSWEEISTASVFGSASDKQDDDFCGEEEK